MLGATSAAAGLAATGASTAAAGPHKATKTGSGFSDLVGDGAGSDARQESAVQAADQKPPKEPGEQALPEQSHDAEPHGMGLPVGLQYWSQQAPGSSTAEPTKRPGFAGLSADSMTSLSQNSAPLENEATLPAAARPGDLSAELPGKVPGPARAQGLDASAELPRVSPSELSLNPETAESASVPELDMLPQPLPRQTDSSMRALAAEGASPSATAAGALPLTSNASEQPLAPRLSAAPGSAAFGAELAEASVRLLRAPGALAGGVQHAEISLNPEELGVLDLHIELNGDELRLRLNAAQADTREALERALPQLRERFSGEGLNLVQAEVGSQRQSDPQTQQQSGAPATDADGSQADQQDDRSPGAPARGAASYSAGLLDQYA